MIFVTVGNALQGFDRLVRAVDEAVGRDDVSSDVLIQRGYTQFLPRYARSVEFLEGDAFAQMLRSANVVVAHAGAGTILQCLRAGKVPVLVPRRKAYNEIVDDHQVEICEELEKQGRISYVRKLDELADKIRFSAKHSARSESGPPRLHFELHNYLTQLAVRRGLHAPGLK